MTAESNDKASIPQDRFEIRLSGSGGQGMIFGSVVLCEAIGRAGDKNVVQSQSYGPEARGGASKADVVVSSEEIYYPKAMKLDLLLAMTQEALDKYYPDLKENGMLVVDNTLVTEIPDRDHYARPFTRLAREEVGHIMVANVVALGAICALTDIVPLDVLTDAVLARAPRGTEDRNRKAIEIGYNEAMKLKKK
ncbi:MAG: 2-oxoacid:acceptor oxidoreductase family protein [Candidatus Zixiibacteriota bacterium]|nr:MAG: 2-oxoacid:acceptor oxidoreductase family protein [candidate division Zixibacteria bacterium]